MLHFLPISCLHLLCCRSKELEQIEKDAEAKQKAINHKTHLTLQEQMVPFHLLNSSVGFLMFRFGSIRSHHAFLLCDSVFLFR